MEDLAAHILDIAENSLRAGASRIKIEIVANHSAHELFISIIDNGMGMPPEQVNQVKDPFFTTRKERSIGLGVALLNQACIEAGGKLEIKSLPGVGTTVSAQLKLSHIDRKPLGKIGDTLLALLLSDKPAEIYLKLARINSDHWEYEFNSAERKQHFQIGHVADYEFLSRLSKTVDDLTRKLEKQD